MKPVHVGLVADPATPTKIARRIRDLDPPGGEDRDPWDIEVVSEPFTTGCEDVDTALGRLGDSDRRCPRVGGGTAGVTASPRWPLASAPGHGAGQPPVAPGARAQVPLPSRL